VSAKIKRNALQSLEVALACKTSSGTISIARYVPITDVEALEAFQLSCEAEGIIPPLEPSYALAHVPRSHPTCRRIT